MFTDLLLECTYAQTEWETRGCIVYTWLFPATIMNCLKNTDKSYIKAFLGQSRPNRVQKYRPGTHVSQ